MYNPFSLDGKTILVTGASSGIGRSIAVECSKMGGKIIITARNEERLNETLMQMEGTGHSIIVADLINKKDQMRLVDGLPELDGLVNCAGIVKSLLFNFMNFEDLDSIMSSNFTSQVIITASLLKQKKIAKNSSIVFISSVVTISTYIGSAMYTASKGAITAMSRTIALELAAKKIRVNCVSPGMTETPLINLDAITQEQLEQDMKRYPLKRYGKPEEIAYAVIYLLSDASSWTTGANLIIDGGYSLQ